jgi:chemotaxis protein MotB
MPIKEDDPPPGAPEWMVTFSDMISLLVTFFILLMTFSTSASSEDFPLSGSLEGAGGIVGRGGHTLPTPPEDDIMSAMDVRRGASVPHARPAARLPESIEEMGQRLTAEHVPVDLAQRPDGLLLHFGEAASFRPGSAAVEPALQLALGEIARVFENYPFSIVVEGYTDSEFKPTPEHPTAESLSLARARAAARVMLESSALPSRLVQVAGLGMLRPRGSNESASERTRNRRVEIRVISLSREVDQARREAAAAAAAAGADQGGPR